MKRRFPLVFAAIAIASPLVSGCASGRGEPFQSSMLQADQAVIYVFRTSSSRVRKRPVQVFVNQAPLSELYPGEYIEDVVTPGEYLVRVESESSMVRSVKLNPGDVIYLQITTVGLNKKPVMETPESDLARRLIAGTTRAQP
jgi:hypothetical protein